MRLLRLTCHRQSAHDLDSLFYGALEVEVNADVDESSSKSRRWCHVMEAQTNCESRDSHLLWITDDETKLK